MNNLKDATPQENKPIEHNEKLELNIANPLGQT